MQHRSIPTIVPFIKCGTVQHHNVVNQKANFFVYFRSFPTNITIVKFYKSDNAPNVNPNDFKTSPSTTLPISVSQLGLFRVSACFQSDQDVQGVYWGVSPHRKSISFSLKKIIFTVHVVCASSKRLCIHRKNFETSLKVLAYCETYCNELAGPLSSRFLRHKPKLALFEAII